MKIGVMEKITSKTVYTYVYYRYKSLASYPVEDYTQYEITEGTDQRAYSWDGSGVIFDENWVDVPEDSTIKITRLIQKAIAFGQDLIIEFSTENILMGITQLNMTGPVLSIMTERIDLGDGKPIGLLEAIQSGSLYEAIKIIDYHLNNMNAYTDLDPFITTDRLTNFKNKITAFLES